jgi:hypothetical protein
LRSIKWLVLTPLISTITGWFWPTADNGQDCKECGSSTRTLGDRSEDNSYDAQERNEAGKRKAPSQFKEREVDGVKGPREENLSLWIPRIALPKPGTFGDSQSRDIVNLSIPSCDGRR